MSITFLHTADWQIGKAFANFPDDAAVPLRQQRIDSIGTIAHLAAEHKVDAVLVAGDVFDMNGVAEKTVRQTLNAMSAYKGLWLLLPGNHDPAVSESVWAQIRRLDRPDNVVILDTPQAFELPAKNAVVLAAPLQRRHDSTDVTDWFDTHTTPTGTIRIGLAHGSIDNRIAERGEAPNTINDKRATRANLDYLALGDWHGTQSIDPRTWYAGTHETDRFKSNDSGNVLLVKIPAAGEKAIVQKIPTGHYRWRQIVPLVESENAVDDIRRSLEELGEPYGNLVIQLSPRGAASLQAKHAIAREVAAWEARVHYLQFDEAALSGQASDEDLDLIGRTGFVGAAVEQLRALAGDENNPERDAAAYALDLLFMEQRELAGKK